MKTINKFDPKRGNKEIYVPMLYACFLCFPNTFFTKKPAVKSENERDD